MGPRQNVFWRGSRASSARVRRGRPPCLPSDARACPPTPVPALRRSCLPSEGPRACPGAWGATTGGCPYGPVPPRRMGGNHGGLPLRTRACPDVWGATTGGCPYGPVPPRRMGGNHGGLPLRTRACPDVWGATTGGCPYGPVPPRRMGGNHGGLPLRGRPRACPPKARRAIRDRRCAIHSFARLNTARYVCGWNSQRTLPVKAANCSGRRLTSSQPCSP